MNVETMDLRSAARAAADAASMDDGMCVRFMSASSDRMREFIDECAALMPDADVRPFRIETSGCRRIHTQSLNPSRLRGAGRILAIIDAGASDVAKLLSVAGANLLWGGRLVMVDDARCI